MARPAKKPPNKQGLYRYNPIVGYDVQGAPIRKNFTSKKSLADAKRKAQEYMDEQRLAELTGQTLISDNVSFAKYAEHWLTVYKKPTVKANTYAETYERTVESYLIPYFRDALLTKIKSGDIQAFFNIMSVKYSQSVLDKMRLCLYGIFDTAIDNDLCYKNPVKNVTVKSKLVSDKKRAYTQQEADELLRFADKHEYGIFIRMLLELGLRDSELCGLQWGDIDWQRKTITIQRAVTDVDNKPFVDKPKSESSIRTLPLSKELYGRLMMLKGFPTAHIALTSRGTIFMPAKFTHLRYDKFFKEIHEMGCKVPRYAPHEMRHTCGTLMYERTGDIYAVSKYLGHSNVNITATLYVHESPELLRKKLAIE